MSHSSSVLRPVQYIQADFLLLYKLMSDLGIRCRRKTPAAAAKEGKAAPRSRGGRRWHSQDALEKHGKIDAAEDQLMKLFRRFLEFVFSKEKFAIKKSPGLLDFKIMPQLSVVRKLRRIESLDEYIAVTRLSPHECGFIDAGGLPKRVIVSADMSPGLNRYSRRRWNRGEREASECRFYQAAKAVMTWKARLDAAIEYAADYRDDNRQQVMSQHQAEFERAMTAHNGRVT